MPDKSYFQEAHIKSASGAAFKNLVLPLPESLGAYPSTNARLPYLKYFKKFKNKLLQNILYLYYEVRG